MSRQAESNRKNIFAREAVQGLEAKQKGRDPELKDPTRKRERNTALKKGEKFEREQAKNSKETVLLLKDIKRELRSGKIQVVDSLGGS